MTAAAKPKTRRPLHGGRYLPQPCKCGSGKAAEWFIPDSQPHYACHDCMVRDIERIFAERAS